MTIWLRALMSLLLLAFPLLTGCSGEQEKTGKKEKSAIEQRTDKAAKEAVDRIKVPLDQAKMAAGQENNHKRQLEEQQKKE
jgi:hypothetical protein